MSYTELHTGKLKKIGEKVTIEDFKLWLQEQEGLEVEDFEYLIEEESEFFQVEDKSKKYREEGKLKK